MQLCLPILIGRSTNQISPRPQLSASTSCPVSLSRPPRGFRQNQFLSYATVAAHYDANQTAMADAMAREFPPGVTFTRPGGGMFCRVTLPDGSNGMDLYRRALAAGVAFIPGKAFFVAGDGGNAFRFNFSNTSENNIAEGAKRLGTVVREIV